MNKIIGILGLMIAISACGDGAETSHTSTTAPTEKLNKEEAVLDESIKQIDAIEKDMKEKEEKLNKALEELQGM